MPAVAGTYGSLDNLTGVVGGSVAVRDGVAVSSDSHAVVGSE